VPSSPPSLLRSSVWRYGGDAWRSLEIGGKLSSAQFVVIRRSMNATLFESPTCQTLKNISTCFDISRVGKSTGRKK
jgi:hypothetical protein